MSPRGDIIKESQQDPPVTCQDSLEMSPDPPETLFVSQTHANTANLVVAAALRVSFGALVSPEP
jgi:hypothetical protein